jgi:hypothetical protein
MHALLHRTSAVAALGAALVAVLAGSWREVSLPELAIRAIVSAAVVFAFVRGAGELAARSILRGLAESEVARRERSREHAASAGERPRTRQAA